MQVDLVKSNQTVPVSNGEQAQKSHGDGNLPSVISCRRAGGLELLSCEERLRKSSFCSLEKRRFLHDFIAAFRYLKGAFR